MANWASTSYAIKGPKEALERIEKAILDHHITEGADEHYEGDILNALGIEWLSRNDDRENGKYMRGFTSDDPWWADDDHTVLRSSAEEAWGITDFYKVLMENFPDVKIYYCVEEPGIEIYATNDKEGTYFSERYYVDACIDGEYQMDYFSNEESMYKWIADVTKNRVKTPEEVNVFNDDYEDSDGADENFIHIYEFEVIDT